MKEVLTIDELVEPDLIKSMHHEYAHNYYWQYGHHGSDDAPRFFVAQHNINGGKIFNCPFQIYLKTKIQGKKISKNLSFKIQNVNLNEFNKKIISEI